MPLPKKKLWVVLGRGLKKRCPACGKSSLYERYIKIRQACPSCHQNLSHYAADDAPPYLTIFLLAHLLVPLFLYLDKVYTPSMEILLITSLPITFLSILIVLPFVKGGVVGVLHYLEKE